MTGRSFTRPTRARYRRGRIGALVVAFVGAAIALWTVRVSIATAVIDRTLAHAHVRARYRIDEVGVARQRLVNVVLGDPAHPDLTADWVELDTHLGFADARVTAVRAGKVALRGRIIDGRLSLGALDRLLPRTTAAAAFRLPTLDLAIGEARLALSTASGAITIALGGSGRLDDGFAGHVSVSSPRLAGAGCVADAVVARTRLLIRSGEPTLAGPIDAARVTCGAVAAVSPKVDLAATLNRGFTAWRGGARVLVGAIAARSWRVVGLAGQASFAGSARITDGQLHLASGAARLANGVTARRLQATGRYAVGPGLGFVGRVAADGAAVPRKASASLASVAATATGTPVAPLAARAARSLAGAADDFDVVAEVRLDQDRLAIPLVEARARGGARAAWVGSAAVIPNTGHLASLNGRARIAGGGLPAIAVDLHQRGPSDGLTGIASLVPYSVGGARLEFATPVRFAVRPDGMARIMAVPVVSGPVAGGRIDRLAMPIDATRGRDGSLSLNAGCARASFDGLSAASTRLDAASVSVCPIGTSLARIVGGRISGGARFGPLRLTGKLGGTPLSLAAAGITILLADRGFAVDRLAARLGVPEETTSLGVARLEGRLTGAGLTGGFAGGEGRIGTVPLLLTKAAGHWRFGRGVLAVTGALRVSDTASLPRFQPLEGEDIDLTLASGRIHTTGRLVSPAARVRVAEVVIDHDLARGAGEAMLTVPGISFAQGFQPAALTPLTLGVVADVRGAIGGDARIGWGPAGVTSTGLFKTDALDLAAAFGPVTGLAGTIRFTDLLALESAPDQVATVASINPGVAVTDGRIAYRTLAGGRVRVSGGHWPFAGGSLDLEPTLLDLSATTDRHLTFTLRGVDAGRFLQQFAFGNMSATGTFDGSLPMIFDADGGRIENGRLQMRSGGGNLAYLGDLTQKDLGFWGNLAFRSLRSLNYRSLTVAMNGPLAGEMITDVRFAGVSQGRGAMSNFLIRRLQRLPFVFNIRIRAPFRGLIDSAQSFYDPSRLIERNLPSLIERQNAAARPATPVQPSATAPRR